MLFPIQIFFILPDIFNSINISFIDNCALDLWMQVEVIYDASYQGCKPFAQRQIGCKHCIKSKIYETQNV